ncbi:hypothetical protein D3C85_1656560 [compost metagenome]
MRIGCYTMLGSYLRSIQTRTFRASFNAGLLRRRAAAAQRCTTSPRTFGYHELLRSDWFEPFGRSSGSALAGQQGTQSRVGAAAP